MKKKSNFLHIEDENSIVKVVQRLLHKEGLRVDTIQVESEKEFKEALNTYPIDLVIADNSLPEHNGLKALRLLRKQNPEIPFILFSGSIGEEKAIADNGEISGVVLVFRDQTKERKTKEALHLKEFIFNSAISANSIANNDGILTHANPAFARIWGYENTDEVIGKPILDFLVDKTKALEIIEALQTTGEWIGEYWALKKDGTVFYARSFANAVYDTEGNRVALYSSVVDISEQKRIETDLRKSYTIINRSPAVVFLWKNEPGWPVEYVSENVESLTGYSATEFTSGSVLFADLIHPEDQQKVVVEVESYSKKHKQNGFSREYRIIRKDGSAVWIDDRTWVERNEQGKITHYQGIILDISERKTMEEALRYSEANYRALFEGISDAVFVYPLRKEGSANFVEVNDAACKLYGYTREEFLNMSPKDISASQAPQLYNGPEERKKLLSKNWLIFEALHVTKDGKTIPVEISSRIFELHGQKVIMSMARDITERKQAEQQVRESEERFRLAFNTIPDAVSLSRTSDGTYIDVNEKFCQLTGYTREEVIGKRSLDINLWVNANDRDHMIKEIKSKGVIDNLEIDFRIKDGKIITALLSAGFLTLHEEKVLLSIAHDISDMKQAREELKKSELKYRTVADHTHDFEYWVGPDGKYIYVSPACKRITGYSVEEFMTDPDTMFRMVKPAYLDLVKKHYLSENHKKAISSGLEFPIVTKQGHERWLEHNCTAVYDEQGHFIGRRGNNRDITERKQAETERERLAIGIEYAAEAVVITDIKGTIQYVNPAFEKISGYSRDEALGKNPRVLKSGRHDQAFYKELWDTITSGNVWRGKIINRHKNGSFYTEEATISPVYDTNKQISNFVAVKRDVTKEEELEQQFLQAQKMDSIGRLAGGVAHDFNNMLSVILGYSELALASLDPQDKLYKNIEEIRNAGLRSADLTRQLLAFSRKQTIDPRTINLNDTVNSMLKMLRRLIGEDINLVWIPGAKLGNIYIDPAQVDQLLANLCVNARDAINGTGNIIIETTQVVFDEAYCADHTYAKPGAYVQLTVSDDGCGINEQVKDKIFEPFFTTKPEGEGTGLGLSTVYGIVKQNDGLINVYSEPGEGTSFKLYFPLKEASQEMEGTEEDVNIPKGNGELILLVEDESSILEMTRKMIESLGYSVLATTSPNEALLFATEQKDEIVLVISDVVMPGINGKQLAEKLKKIHSNMNILFMSGYTSDVIANHGVLEKGVQIISKPFTLPELAQKIHDVLR